MNSAAINYWNDCNKKEIRYWYWWNAEREWRIEDPVSSFAQSLLPNFPCCFWLYRKRLLGRVPLWKLESHFEESCIRKLNDCQYNKHKVCI